MNKKFLVGALLVALSTAGYAYDEVGKDTIILGGMVPSHTDINNNFAAVQQDVNNINNSLGNLNSTLDGLNQQIGEQANKNNEQQDQIDQNTTNIGNIKNELGNKVDQGQFDEVKNNLESLQNQANGNSQALGELGQDIVDLNNKKADKTEVEDLKTQVENNTATTTTNSQLIGNLTQEVESVKGDVDFVKGEVERVEGEVTDLQNKVETGFDNLQNQVSGNSQALGEMGQDIVALEKENDKQNDRLDAAEDRLDLGDRIDKVQNQQIGNLQSQNIAQDKNIQANKDAIAANKAEQDKVNAAQKENNEQQQAAIDKNTSDIKDHGNRLDTLENNYAQYDGRLSGLEKKVDHLDDKMNKGLSLMAAMNAVDFQNVQTGEMALGAGIGHYGNAQSVALGVAYAPVEDLTVNAKYSITAGDPDSFAVGAGATYKFKVGR